MIKPWLKMIPVKWYDIISLHWNDIISLHGLNCPIKYLYINGSDQSGCMLYFSWRQLWLEHSLFSFLSEMAASARFLSSFVKTLPVLLKKPKTKIPSEKTNQGLGLFKAFLRQTKSHRSLKNTKTWQLYACLQRFILSVQNWTCCERSSPLAAGIERNQDEKLQIFYYPVSWQYFACNFAVYVTLTELRKLFLFRRLLPHEEMINKLPKLSSVVLLFRIYLINKL